MNNKNKNNYYYDLKYSILGGCVWLKTKMIVMVLIIGVAFFMQIMVSCCSKMWPGQVFIGFIRLIFDDFSFSHTKY